MMEILPLIVMDNGLRVTPATARRWIAAGVANPIAAQMKPFETEDAFLERTEAMYRASSGEPK